MIITTYRCDLCKREVRYPYGGYRLQYSGCGGIGFLFLDTDQTRVSESIICKGCVRGLSYAMGHMPHHPNESDDDNG